MPSSHFHYQKDDQVFVLVPDQASSSGAGGKGSLAASKNVTPVSATKAPSPKWQTGKVVAVSDSAVEVVPSFPQQQPKAIEVKANDFESRIFPRSAVKEFLEETKFDLAALPRSIKTQMLLDCFLKNASSTLPSDVSTLDLACGTGGAIFLSNRSSKHDQENYFSTSSSLSSNIQNNKFIVVGSRDTFHSLLCCSSFCSQKQKSKIETTLDNVRRVLSWFFGGENYSAKMSMVVSIASSNADGDNAVAADFFSFYCIPNFNLSKANILPNGETLSSSVEAAAQELGISSGNLQIALSWLLGVQKLWRLTPAASGFRGTEPDLVEAASCLLSGDDNDSSVRGETAADAVKFLADFLSTDKSNAKAPAAQLDEKRAAIAQCVLHEICASLFFEAQQTKLVEKLSRSNGDQRNKFILFLSEVPSLNPSSDFGLEIKTTPLVLAVLESLKIKFEGGGSGGGSGNQPAFPFRDLLKKLSEITSSTLASLESFNRKPYAEVSKTIVSALTCDSPCALQAGGKDGFVFSSTYFSSSEKFRFPQFSWASKILTYRMFFNKSSGGSKHFEVSRQILEGFLFNSSSSNNAVISPTPVLYFHAAAPAVLDDLLSPLLVPAIEYFRSQPVEVLNSRQIENLKFFASSGKKPFASLQELSTKLLEKMVSSGAFASPSTFGSFDPETSSLKLSVLGKVALEKLKMEFAQKTLSHVFRHIQYRNSALIVLRKCCIRRVQTLTGTGILSRLSTQVVAERSAKSKMQNFIHFKRNSRQSVEDDETGHRESLFREEERALGGILNESGAFLRPLIRRRKENALRDEVDGRLELMSREVKERRILVERFFAEEPDDAVPAPIEALEKIRRRYERVKPALDDEEATRKEILMEHREELVKLLALLELEKEQIRSAWRPTTKKERTVPWKDVEKAALRRRMDEERAFSFLFGDRSASAAQIVDEHVRSPSNYFHFKKQDEQLLLQRQQHDALIRQRQHEVHQALVRSSTSKPQISLPVRDLTRQSQQKNSSLHPPASASATTTFRANNNTSTVVNETNQKSGPAPLRVSFAAYWANQYKK